ADDDESMDYIMNLENKGKIVRVHFIGDAANEAVISDVAKKFSVTINILQGKLTQTISGVLGTLTIQLQGEKEAINEAITFIEKFYMTLISVAATFILGILLGLLLYLTDKNGLWQNKIINFITATFVNVFRAIPFIILILLLFPFTDFIVGTIRGPKAALPAL